MAKLKVRHLVSKPGARGAPPRFFWEPSKSLRRAGWKTRRLRNPDKSYCVTEFEAAKAAEIINDQVDAIRLGGQEASGSAPGTISALIRDYKASRHYAKLAPKTRHDYEQYLELIEAWAGDQPVVAICSADISELYAKIAARAPRRAAYLVAVLRRVLECARLIYKRGAPGYIEINPAARLDIAGGGFTGRLWPRDAVTAVAAAADRMERWSIGTAVILNDWIGQREGDVLALSHGLYREGALHIEQSKTKKRVILPIDDVPHLVGRIRDERRRQETRRVTATTLIVSETTGRRYTSDNFRAVFAGVRREAVKQMPEAARLRFKDLRHTAVTNLAMANVEIPLIAMVTGHSVETVRRIIDHYLIFTREGAATAFRMRMEQEARRPGGPTGND